MIGGAKLPDVERESVTRATSRPYAIIIRQAVVHIIYIVFRRKILINASRQLAHVAAIPQQNGISLVAVASGTARLLKISLYGVGAVEVDAILTLGLSMPMPKALVATMTRFLSSCHNF